MDTVSADGGSDFAVRTDAVGGATKSVRQLQAAMRAALQGDPGEAGLRRALARIGAHFEGVYVALQTNTAHGEVAVDWAWEGFASIAGLQESLGESLPAVVATGESQCVSLADGAAMLLSVPVFGPNGSAAGTASAVVAGGEDTDGGALIEAFEGAVGYLVLLHFHAPTTSHSLGPLPIPEGDLSSAGDPLYLAYALVAHLRNRYQLEQVLFGFVRRGKVRVVAVSGVDEVRSSNPGVKAAAAAMEECLDCGEPIVCEGEPTHEDLRLHAQWRHRAGGGCVATIPMRDGEATRAVVAIRAGGSRTVTSADLAEMRDELQGFTWFLPVAERAHRSLPGHLADSGRAALRRLFGPVHWRSRALGLLFVAAILWCVFGTLPFSFTVPCRVLPIAPRKIACPHDGVLREVAVEVGQNVKQGEVLAYLDTQKVRREKAMLVADLARLEAKLDVARAASQLGEVQVLMAQQTVLQTRIDLVTERIQDCRIQAPQDGVILSGELLPRVGDRLARGDELFVLATPDEVRIEVMIPESRVAEAQACTASIFAPAARPSARVKLDGLRMLPASMAGDGANLFRGRSDPIRVPQGVLPGMEGMVYLEIGDRPVWWIFTHHITDWLRLRFWL